MQEITRFTLDSKCIAMLSLGPDSGAMVPRLAALQHGLWTAGRDALDFGRKRGGSWWPFQADPAGVSQRDDYSSSTRSGTRAILGSLVLGNEQCVAEIFP
jgi:hypothetical protein